MGGDDGFTGVKNTLKCRQRGWSKLWLIVSQDVKITLTLKDWGLMAERNQRS
jgi:hypothetical protein